jgi:hypothetical protein
MCDWMLTVCWLNGSESGMLTEYFPISACRHTLLTQTQTPSMIRRAEAISNLIFNSVLTMPNKSLQLKIYHVLINSIP